MTACAACGEQNPQRARFCLACGSLLVQAPERRKLATILFSDMSGSTAMGERVDAESVRDMMARYFAAMREAVERHGGTVEKYIGDAVMAVFGVPIAREDDALRAVRAAYEMQKDLEALNEDFRLRFGSTVALRIGVNTGEVVAGAATTRQTIVTGDAVNVAARLEQAAAPGDVLLGPQTYHLVRAAVAAEPIPPLSLKGKSKPIQAFRLLEVDQYARGRPQGVDGPLVGREAELVLLHEHYRAARARRCCRLVTIVGEPGVGKSRLAREFVSALGDDATVLVGRCLSYGQAITYWPLAEIVREAAGIRDSDTAEEARTKVGALVEGTREGEVVATRVAQAIGLDSGAAAPEEISWGARKLLEALAGRRPLLVLIDDLQWAEPPLLDLLAQLPDRVSDAPILVICIARPELLEAHPEWTADISLESLAKRESEQLVESLLSEARLPTDLRAQIVRAAAGNPLFVEELVAMLVDEGVLRREQGLWRATSDLGEHAIPPSLSSLLGARLDRLPTDARAAAECGAVEGEVFHEDAVIALSTSDARATTSASLTTLVRAALVRPAKAEFGEDRAFRFRHLLLRDATYRATAKKLRAELHERFAAWLEGVVGERLSEFEEIVGYHFEQAYRYREELGPVDERGRNLARCASDRLCSSAHRASRRGDYLAAVTLFERGIAVTEAEDTRSELLAALGEVLLYVGDFHRAHQVLVDAIRLDEERSSGRAELSLLKLRLLTDPRCDVTEIRDRAQAILERLRGSNDDGGLARNWRLLADLQLVEGRCEATERALERALQYARRAGDRSEENEATIWLATLLMHGPAPREEALGRCRVLLADSANAPRTRSAVLGSVALLEAMGGRFAEARALVGEQASILGQLGNSMNDALASGPIGEMELLAGDAAAAERVLLLGFEEFQRRGEVAYLSTHAALLAEALYRQGRHAEAERFTRISEEAAAPMDLVSQVTWRRVRAKVLARRGHLHEACLLAQQGVALGRSGDFLNVRGDSLLDLAEVLHLADRDAEAAVAADEAIDIFGKKGNLSSLERAHAVRGDVVAAVPRGA